MSTKLLRQRQHRLTPPPPVDISIRKLPPLPIEKRKLPTLPQSKSYFGRRNNCIEPRKTKGNPKVLSKNIIITPPNSTTSPRHRVSAFHSFFKKIGGSKVKTAETHKNESVNNIDSNIKSKWRPSLQYIIDDEELLNTLSMFMRKQYNEENILFLESVNALKYNINELLMSNSENNIVKKEKIYAEISFIYNKYIVNNAEKQINLSGECFNEIMYIKQKYTEYPLSKQALIFERSCIEISNLIQNSILSGFYGFYQCNPFQTVARSRNMYSNVCRNVQEDPDHRNVSDDTGYDSDDIEYLNECETSIQFDRHSMNKWRNNNKWMLSSNGFASKTGIHEWKIKILKSGSQRQEVGVVSTNKSNIDVNEFGICDTPAFGARAVYGYNNMNPTFYYASYNKDNSVRINKDISSLNIHQNKQWVKGDVIRIQLNQTKLSMRFFLNGKPVRKTISVQKDTTYYPIILYSGSCKYQVIP